MKNIFVIFILHLQAFGQETPVSDSLENSNPVVFAEIFAGLGGSGAGMSFMWNGTINYQFRKTDLMSFRYSQILVTKLGGTAIGYAGSPTLNTEATIDEYALLYGKRWISNGTSFSISGGLSLSKRKSEQYFEIINSIGIKGYQEIFSDDYVGFPVELSLKWFKARKSVFRAYYGIIPIGRTKVAFGRSVGLKISGNFGKTNYLGMGISYGFGLHKNY